MNFPTLTSLLQLVNVEPLCIYHGIEISASQIPSPANKITTRASRGLKSKKSKALLALDSQEQFDRVETASKRDRKKATNLKNGQNSYNLDRRKRLSC